MLQPILLLIILIFLNAVFASAEIAVISINEAKLRKMSADGDIRARKLTCLTEQPARFLATIQVAITLAGLLQSAFAAENFATPLVSALVNVGVKIPESILKTVAIIVITLVLSYFNLVFGELVPKRLGMKKAESIALGLSRMLYSVSKICAPIVWLLTASTNGVLRLFGINPDEEDEQVTEEAIRLMLYESNEQGHIQPEENEIIQNVFEFNDISVDEICTHRRDVILLYMKDDVKQWHETICKSRHTYYPICGKNRDEIIAVLDTKGYLRLENKSKDTIIKEATGRPMYILEHMKANVVFREMKNKRKYFAIVLDEYGGMSGIITLHDLMEALVGDLSDEEETEEIIQIQKIEDGKWKIHGTASLREVSQELGYELEMEECDTFSGYISNIISRVPNDGEKFTCKKDILTIEVEEVKNHVIGMTTVYVK